MKSNQSNAIESTILVIFGGAGDLTWRKLAPALFDLSQNRGMPDQFAIIIVDRVDSKEEKIRKRLVGGVKKFSRHGKGNAEDLEEFAKKVQFLQGDFKDPKTYQTLGERCEKLEKKWDVDANRIFYMATPPILFGEIPKYLDEAGLSNGNGNSRIVVEKPIGHDLDSARELNNTLLESFNESQIFRIDHYLGKETVQNILAFRFGNPLFEPLWNRGYVDYVAITVAEEIGVENRGEYYDSAGQLRDMVQNHLTQILCLIAMEPMVSFDADEIRNKKVDVLHAIRPIRRNAVHESVVRGQYAEGWIDREKVCAYREEEGVSPDSQSETYVALKLFIDNWRWRDVPFYLRTGKRLPLRSSEVVVQFQP
ncbi:MAG: glucose-6-phosphate dehydrogenase, partial [Candidatus Omnitrophica bacterium]|nr:glucose-6-phosphate dehydrogenase [Candidatus Omnitrophota bacterium]